MKFPVTQSGPSIEPAAASGGESSTSSVGIAREDGEGGFYARIMFQDASNPTHYAFVQVHRIYDPTDELPDVNFFLSEADVAGDGNDYPMPYGEQSLWNVGDEAAGQPFAQVTQVTPDSGDPTQGTYQAVPAPSGQVFNWAREDNDNPNVPNGTVVWLRGGTEYIDPATGSARKDYHFSWGQSIYALVTGTDGEGNYQWTEQYRARDRGSPSGLMWTKPPNPRGSSGTPTAIIDPIKEINGKSLPIGVVVPAIPGQPIQYNSDDGTVYSQEWICQYESANYGDYQPGTNHTSYPGYANGGYWWTPVLWNTTDIDPAYAVVSLDLYTLYITQPGSYQITWAVSFEETNSSCTAQCIQTAHANLYLNNATPPTPPDPASTTQMQNLANAWQSQEALFYPTSYSCDGTTITKTNPQTGITLNTVLVVTDADLKTWTVGGNPLVGAAINLSLQVTLNGDYTTAQLGINDNEVVIHE